MFEWAIHRCAHGRHNTYTLEERLNYEKELCEFKEFLHERLGSLTTEFIIATFSRRTLEQARLEQKQFQRKIPSIRRPMNFKELCCAVLYLIIKQIFCAFSAWNSFAILNLLHLNEGEQNPLLAVCIIRPYES